ncbi:MAG: TldD/PmbA family protein, partial [Chloroflexi bacterium]|nr:TldD/PmbA family protein [Chloroflexota bacterium]
MLGESRIKNLIETTLALSSAVDTEVSLSAVEEGVTRFANNAIIQNVAETNADLKVR